MGECDHIISSLVAGGISGFLHTFIKSGSVLILLETVNEFPVFILEIFRCGGSDRLRRADSDECNSLSAGLHHFVRFKNGFSGSQILKVTGQVGKRRFLHKRQELIHSVIKFVVSGYGEVVTDLIHNINDIFALG